MKNLSPIKSYKSIIRESDSSLHNYKLYHEYQFADNINPYNDYYPLLNELPSFKERHSILSEYHNSKFRQSIFFGYYQLVFMFSIFFFVCHPTLKYIDQGVFFDETVLNSVKNSFIESLLIWPYFIIYSHTAYILEIIARKGLPYFFQKLIQYLSQMGVLITSLVVAYTQENWYPSSRAFVSIMSWVFYMKMHSYTNEMRKIRSQPQKYNEFFYFIWIPTFIFKRDYPRNKKVDFEFLLVRTVYTFFGFLAMYILVSDWVYPLIEQRYNMPFLEIFMRLIEVSFILNILVFYIILEILLQIFGEITRFADREFYQDWWNSTTYLEFMLKWNRPVSDFLQQYVRYPLIKNRRMSNTLASIITSLLSALGHEMIFLCAIRTFKPFLFIVMIIQVPIFQLFYPLKGNYYGNLVFWVSYIMIVPAIFTYYLKYEY